MTRISLTLPFRGVLQLPASDQLLRTPEVTREKPHQQASPAGYVNVRPVLELVRLGGRWGGFVGFRANVLGQIHLPHHARRDKVMLRSAS